MPNFAGHPQIIIVGVRKVVILNNYALMFFVIDNVILHRYCLTEPLNTSILCSYMTYGRQNFLYFVIYSLFEVAGPSRIQVVFFLKQGFFP